MTAKIAKLVKSFILGSISKELAHKDERRYCLLSYFLIIATEVKYGLTFPVLYKNEDKMTSVPLSSTDRNHAVFNGQLCIPIY